ncbi:MAG: hypothetical protein A3J39_08425 [Sulfuricurvum sp. RIFCSPHIGHO2_12_FULL_44_8]|nr:MAG: hypothetical protein A3J39_08425 [Sulfuricurvum sp. RIFCSPHIGHO2_12_FULL_44_8]
MIMINFIKKLVFSVLVFTAIVPTLKGADWMLTYGIHDFIVTQQNSHSFGVDMGIGIAGEAISESGVLLKGDFTVFFVHDRDKIDPDYEPIWYKTNIQIKRELYPLTTNIGTDWLISFDGKLNTLSGVEKQSKLFAGIGTDYTTSAMMFELKILAGYYFLEIDDDVPSVFGYVPDDFQHETAAYTFIADSEVKLNRNMKAYTRIQQWRDTNQWLENQYELILSYDSAQWLKGSGLNISAEHTRYNLNPYQKVGFPPILPWNKDTLVRVYITVPLR